MKPANKSEQGRLGRARGKAFELKTRHYLESKGFRVCKWNNQIDFEKNIVIPAKTKYNPFTKTSTQGNGFPDFIAYRQIRSGWVIIGIESKLRKYLDPEEKKMAQWLLDNEIFDEIFTSYQNDNCKSREGNKKHIDFKNFKTEKEYCEIDEGLDGYD